MQQISIKIVYDYTQLGGEDRSTGNCARNWNFTMVYGEHRIRPIKWNVQNSLGYWDTNVSFNLGQTT